VLHILPTLGDRRIDSITRANIRALVEALIVKPARPRKKAKGKAAEPPRTLSRKTIENVVRVLSAILTQAVEDGLLPANPAFRLGRYYREAREPGKKIEPLTLEETRAFLNAAREHTPREYPLFVTACLTGMRLGELLGLQWGDVDFHGGFIEVRRGLVRGQLATPKNGKTRRIDLAPTLATVLEDQRRRQKTETLRNGWQHAPEWVFSSETGGPLDTNNVRKHAYHRALEKAGLRQVRIHDLRHGFATLLLQQGESLAYVRDQLGHSAI